VTGAEVIALVSVVSSALVGPSLTAAWGLGRARWESHRQREDALVEILEAAAIDFSDTYARLHQDMQEMAQGASRERRQELGDAQTLRLLGLWQHETKIGLRLTPLAEITRSYRDGAQQLSLAAAILSEVAAGERLDSERRQAINTHSSAAFNKLQTYLDLAARRVGPGSMRGLPAPAGGVVDPAAPAAQA
jgi:hypothetical protein